MQEENCTKVEIEVQHIQDLYLQNISVTVNEKALGVGLIFMILYFLVESRFVFNCFISADGIMQ